MWIVYIRVALDLFAMKIFVESSQGLIHHTFVIEGVSVVLAHKLSVGILTPVFDLLVSEFLGYTPRKEIFISY